MMAFKVPRILWIAVLLPKDVLSIPALNDGQDSTSVLPPFDKQITEIYNYFSPNCALHVILGMQEEPLGQLAIPHILTFPKGKVLSAYEWLPHISRARTHGLSRDILRYHCLVTVVLATRNLRFSKEVHNEVMDLYAYLMQTGTQGHLKYPEYDVFLTDMRCQVEGWCESSSALQLVPWHFFAPGAGTYWFLFYDLKTSAELGTEIRNPVGARLVCYHCRPIVQQAYLGSPPSYLEG